MTNLEDLLRGGDLRSLGQSGQIVGQITGQERFDELFRLLFHSDRLVVMRAADVVEKVTVPHPGFLAPHKKKLLALMGKAVDKELKWHLALLAPRIQWTEHELGIAWHTLTGWATDRKESRIVRVNSLQGLHDLLPQDPALRQDFSLTVRQLDRENIPSISVRIRKLAR